MCDIELMHHCGIKKNMLLNQKIYQASISVGSVEGQAEATTADVAKVHKAMDAVFMDGSLLLLLILRVCTCMAT